MIRLQEGNIVYNLLKVIAYAGEFPVSAVRMLGAYTSTLKRVRDMTEKQEYINDITKERRVCTALSIVGRGKEKTIHLLKNGWPLLEWMGMLDIYLKTTNNGKFKTDQKDRHHRVAEVVAAFVAADMPVVNEGDPDKNNYPMLYLNKYEDKVNCYDKKEEKIMFSRMIGGALNNGVYMTTYNTRGRPMKMLEGSEFKSKRAFERFAKVYTGTFPLNSALLFGTDYFVGEKVVKDRSEETAKGSVVYHGLGAVYSRICFVPLNDKFGVELLKLIMRPDFHKRVVENLVPESINEMNGMPPFESDGKVNGTYVFSFLDSNISRLLLMREGLDAYKKEEYPVLIYCYPEQVKYVKSLFNGCNVEIQTLTITDVNEAIE